MNRSQFYNVHVNIPEPINTDYDRIAKRCDFETEFIQPTGSVISPSFEHGEIIKVEYVHLSEDEAIDLYKSFY